MERILIGELARRTGVPVSTIRYYERNGLLAVPERRESGYREYPEATIDRLQFIRHAQELGFRLQQIKTLLVVRTDPHARSALVRAEAERCMSDIQEKISSLASMEASLSRVLSCCDGTQPADKCPIMIELQSPQGGSNGSHCRSVHSRMRRL